MRQAQSARAQQQSSRPQLIQSMIDAMRVPDLRSKILFTLGMLVVFRFVAQVPISRRRYAAAGTGFSTAGASRIPEPVQRRSAGELERRGAWRVPIHHLVHRDADTRSGHSEPEGALPRRRVRTSGASTRSHTMRPSLSRFSSPGAS